jgi:hypothetical protein
MDLRASVTTGLAGDLGRLPSTAPSITPAVASRLADTGVHDDLDQAGICMTFA